MFILTEKQQFDQYRGVRKDISLTSMLCRKWIGNNIYTELRNKFFHPYDCRGTKCASIRIPPLLTL